MRKETKILILNAFFAISILIGCSARKSEIVKDKEVAKEFEKIESVYFDWSKLLEQNESLDKGVIYVREFSDNGYLKKETITKNNKLEYSIKSSNSIKYKRYNIIKTTYKSVATYKKNTQKEAVSNRVYYFAFFLIFLFVIILNWKRIIEQ